MNITLILGLIIPPLLYALIIYLTSPYKTIRIARGLYHIVAGTTSIILLSFIFVAFPNYTTSSVKFFDTFFFIAPREEFVKLVLFLLMGKLITRKEREHPVATMFYMGMVGLGFAMYENLHYVGMYGESVLGIRTFTATIAHMIFGLSMGYWIAKGNIDNGRGYRSVFGVIMKSKPKLKRIIYMFIGWLSAVGYHGLWNYNLMVSSQAYTPTISDVSSSPIMIMMIFFGLVAAKLAHKDLIDSHNKSKSKS